jgi:catechol 2,3-dioxygenase-like lactoylglutathione lyase family enzyme
VTDCGTRVAPRAMGELPRVVRHSVAMDGLRIVALDHIVLWSSDVERSVAFYCDVLGCAAERLEEWRAGQVFFPSVRLSADTLIDVFPGGREGIGDAAARNLHHFCLAVESDDLAAVRERLVGAGVRVEDETGVRWGAHGDGDSIYVHDPDGNLIELKVYGSRG